MKKVYSAKGGTLQERVDQIAMAEGLGMTIREYRMWLFLIHNVPEYSIGDRKATNIVKKGKFWK